MSGFLVSEGAMLQCPFGSTPAPLTVTPEKNAAGEELPLANIMDIVPGKNIPVFGTCQSLANPAVASATSAALGVLTPMPCTPAVSPWVPGCPNVIIKGQPAVDQTCTCVCSCGGGTIVVVAPGQTNVVAAA